MGVQFYDPGGRIAASARPRVIPSRQQPQQAAPAKPSTVTRSGTFDEWALRRATGAPEAPVPTPPKEEKGLGESFFESTVGKGLGVVLNNPVVKAALQPLDVIGVPGRAALGLLEADINYFKTGNATSPGELYNRINPLHFIHGENAEDMVSGGQIVQQLGGTGNRWGDAAAGFALDVGLDPSTYAGGAGVVDKGLDAFRSGTRLATAIERKGALAAEEAAAAAARGSRFVAGAEGIEDVAGAVSDAVGPLEHAHLPTNPMAGRGSRASLTGRQARQSRVQQAAHLLRSADADAIDELYGGSQLVKEAQEELMRLSGRGLGAGSGRISPGAQELLDTALNIKPPAIRWHVPFTKISGEVPGTQRVARGLANTVGDVRMALNNSKFGSMLADVSSPLDVEAAAAVMRKGENAAPDEFQHATSVYRAFEKSRPVAGEYLNEGQRVIRGQRRNMLDDIKEAGGDAAYIRRAELGFDEFGKALPDTRLNKLFKYFGNQMAEKHGVSIPKLSSGRLKYVPHVFTPEFLRHVESGGRQAVEQLVERWGITGQDLVGESGRLKRRAMMPEFEVTMADGTVKNTAEMSIDELNTLVDVPGYTGKIVQDNPIKLVEDYVQAVSEDVGRRAGRADMIAEGNPFFRYADDMSETQANEAAMEQVYARARTTPGGEQPASWGKAQKEVMEAEAAGIPLAAQADPRFTERIIDGIANRDIEDFVQSALDEFKRVGNSTTMVHPAVDDMFRNLKKHIRNPKAFEQAFRKATNYFKTYATLSPGFHVRNALSAIFMNAADGVALRTTARGFGLWQEFEGALKKATDLLDEGATVGERINAEMRAAEAFLQSTSKTNRQALQAVWGSGAGGRFAEAGVAEGSSVSSRLGSKLLENYLTRTTQNIGARVEGGARTGMALDTIESGGSVQDAMSRITRVHFDYSQTSRLDDSMKGIVPFWSFVSRNMPLQVMQQWSRPAAYSTYQHFMENIADPSAIEELGGEESIPEYIRQGKGVPLNLGPFNWFEPDLPQTRLNEDVERFGNVLKNPAGALSNVNPLITAPIEYGTHSDLFTGQRFGPEDYEQISNPIELLAVLPAAVAGQLEVGTDGKLYVKSEAMQMLYAVDPTLSRATRLGSGASQGKPWEMPARWFGAPVRQITPEQIESAEAGAYYDELDARKKQDVLAGLGG